MKTDEAQRRAILSILDVLEELCMGLAYRQTPQTDWADQVKASFDEHRDELRDAVPA